MSDQADDYVRLLVLFASKALEAPPQELATLLEATALPGAEEAENLLDLYTMVAGEDDPTAGIAKFIKLSESAMDAGHHELAALLLALIRAVLRRVESELDQASLAAAIDNATAILALQRGRPDLAEPLLEAAERNAVRAGDGDVRAAVLLNRVNVARLNGEPELAAEKATEALTVYESRSDNFGVAQWLLTLADIALDASRDEAAAELVARLEPLIGSLRAPGLTAHLRALQGRIASDAGQFEEADKYYKAALLAARRSGVPHKIAAAQQDLAVLAQRSGRPGLARRRYEAALLSADEAHEASRLIVIHESLARVLHQLGRFADAVDHAQAAVQLGSQTALPGAPERSALLAATLLSIDEHEQARRLLREAIPALESDDLQMALSNFVASVRGTKADPGPLESLIAQNLDRLTPPQRVEVLEDLAGLWLASGAVNRAVSLFSDALELVDDAQRAWRTAMAAAELAAGPEPSAAENFYRLAMEVCDHQGQRQVAALVRGDLAVLLGNLGRHDDALVQLRATSAEAEQLGDRELLQRVQHNEAETLRRLGDYDAAVTAAETALELAQALGDERVFADAYVALGLAFASAGRDGDAESALRAALSIGEPTADIRATVSGALAGISFRRGDTDLALKQYRAAARLDRTPLQRAESLLGVCACYAAAGNERSHDRNLQVLIDIAQEHHLERHIAPDLTFVAQEWIQRSNWKAAGQVLGLALILAFTGSARVSPDGPDFDVTTIVAEPLMQIGNFLNEETPLALEGEVESAMWGFVMRHITDADSIDVLRNWLRDARDILKEVGDA